MNRLLLTMVEYDNACGPSVFLEQIDGLFVVVLGHNGIIGEVIRGKFGGFLEKLEAAVIDGKVTYIEYEKIPRIRIRMYTDPLCL